MAVIFAVALVARGLYFLRAFQVWGGARVAADTQTYRGTCEILLTEPLSALSAGTGLMYMGFTIPFCFVDNLTGQAGSIWVMIQIFLSSLTAVVLFWVGTRLVNQVAGLTAGIAFALLFDGIRYTVFLLSETMFIFVLVLCLWAITRHWKEPSRKTRIIALTSLGWLAITRPFGMPIVVGWLLLDLLPGDNQWRFGLIPRWTAVAGVIVAPVIILTLSSAPGKLSQMEAGFRGGWIIYKGMTDFFIAEYAYEARPRDKFLAFLLWNLGHVLVMIVLRVVVFFVPLVDNWISPCWNLANILVLTPLLAGSILGVVWGIKRRDLRPMWLLATPIVVVTGIVVVTFISVGWRYRAPLGPLFALLTSYAVAISLPNSCSGLRSFERKES
jgi:4-amino-4-deoxy-L-arabinose transferase-like glycosyltransferase